ncbi:MAG: Ig-like domain-containing protein, partial [Bacteroidetes bacterium]|nr:Ig-like domain-containing protein [Bacteroidota bacterium]
EFDTNVSDWEAEIPEVLSTLELKDATINIGESETLIPNLIPSNAGVTYEWVSSDVNIATVANGVVTANATTEGTATITVTAKDGVTSLATATCEVTVTEDDNAIIHFQDDVFREVLLNKYHGIDVSGDNEISKSEAKDYTGEINVDGVGITSLDGIQYFTNITTISCNKNNINGSLDFSNNTLLENISCFTNNLSSINVSNNIKLINFVCANNILESINIEGNPDLDTFICAQNRLKTLDVSFNLKLTNLNCNVNPQLNEINLNSNDELLGLECSGTNISVLDLSGNLKLTDLGIGNTPIENIDLAYNVKLKHLSCTESEIGELNLESNLLLANLECSGTRIRSLNLKNNVALIVLKCSNCDGLRDSGPSETAEKLDLRRNDKLQEFECIGLPGISEILVWPAFEENDSVYQKDAGTSFVK